MKASIAQVFPKPRDWASAKYPDACSVEGLFSDGSKWEVNTKTSKAPEYIATLNGFLNVEQEYECEPKPDYQGQKNWKLKSWPGKAQAGSFGSGGGKSYTPAFGQTAEGEHFIQERMDRRTALMQAVAASVSLEHGDITGIADTYYQWLRSTCPAVPVSTPPAPSPIAEAKPAQKSNGAAQASVGEFWEGPGQCMKCHAPEGKRHGRPCVN